MDMIDEQVRASGQLRGVYYVLRIDFGTDDPIDLLESVDMGFMVEAVKVVSDAAAQLLRQVRYDQCRLLDDVQFGAQKPGRLADEAQVVGEDLRPRWS